MGEIKTDEPDTVYNLSYTYYNAAHWDGNEWELVKLMYSDEGTVIEGISIYAFSENNILVSAGTLFSWNGNEWNRWKIELDTFPGGINTIWGTSSTNIYFVGNNGSIVHYDGSSFTLMESSTDTPIIDLWGTDENHIWATAYDNTIDEDHPEGYESVTLFYDGTSWEKLYVHTDGYWPDVTDSISGAMTSVWAFEDTVYICSASGIWAKPVNGKSGVLHQPDLGFNSWGFKSIRGNGYNDIFITTPFSQTFHFNGTIWKKIETYSDEHPGGALLSYGGLDVKGDMVAVAGVFYHGIAFIMRGYRME